MPATDHPPLIGVTVDNRQNTAASGQYESACAYSAAVVAAGGVPVLLPHQPGLAGHYAALCAGLILTGGGDPAMEAFGEATHPHARVMDPRRQVFELALLTAVADRPEVPVLGVCLGMQLMALHADGALNQFLPETLGAAATLHQGNRRHPIRITDACVFATDTPEAPQVVSAHRQAVANAGRLTVVATAPDGTIEAIADPARTFYLGVQWHPERAAAGDCPAVNEQLFQRLVQAAARAKAPAASNPPPPAGPRPQR